MNCPICSHALEGGELVMVCNPCHKALGGGLNVNATGEFRVPTQQELLDHLGTSHLGTSHDPSQLDASHLGHSSPMTHENTTNVCSWCGKLEAQVKKLLGRGGAALCNECVSLASDIMEAELGADWR